MCDELGVTNVSNIHWITIHLENKFLFYCGTKSLLLYNCMNDSLSFYVIWVKCDYNKLDMNMSIYVCQ